MPKQRLELTWIGKNNRPKLEPRILIEDPEKSFGNPDSENMLIHGDNLLALKALEQDYAGRVKCIYIDPPYNTGNAFEHYDDGLEHSIWLSLMRDRLLHLQTLLATDGFIFVQIDNNEMAYLKVLLDEIFGRENFVNDIVWKRRGGSANPSNRLNNVTDYILWYSKSQIYAVNHIFSLEDENTKEYIEERFNNLDEKGRRFMKSPIQSPNLRPNLRYEYKGYKVPKNGWSISKELMEKWDEEGKLWFPDSKDKNINRKIYLDEYRGQPVGNLWTDIKVINPMSIERTSFEGGQKPEALIRRIIELSTNPGDLVMDSFLGSGTTAAVAHKLGRRWIGIELGEHCYSHCKPRLDKVVSGEDQGGISKTVEWKGGGGYKFYELAPSLLNKDSFGNWVINKKYNADMLAAAMAKHEGFRYSPDPEVYWKQGKSTERDFIITTTEFFSQEHLDHIESQMSEGESLLICCKAFNADDRRFPNVTIKKIPQILMGKCEFGKEDYSLNIVNVPFERDIQDLQPDELSDSELEPRYVAGQRELFDLENGDE